MRTTRASVPETTNVVTPVEPKRGVADSARPGVVWRAVGHGDRGTPDSSRSKGTVATRPSPLHYVPLVLRCPVGSGKGGHPPPHTVRLPVSRPCDRGTPFFHDSVGNDRGHPGVGPRGVGNRGRTPVSRESTGVRVGDEEGTRGRDGSPERPGSMTLATRRGPTPTKDRGPHKPVSIRESQVSAGYVGSTSRPVGPIWGRCVVDPGPSPTKILRWTRTRGTKIEDWTSTRPLAPPLPCTRTECQRRDTVHVQGLVRVPPGPRVHEPSGREEVGTGPFGRTKEDVGKDEARPFTSTLTGGWR